MILSDRSILEMVESGQIHILPKFDKSQLRPFGIRVHIDDEILIPEPNQLVDLSDCCLADLSYKKISIRDTPLILYPGDFVIASTIERIRVSQSLVCRLDGRSTLARLGLTIHCTSELLDSIHVNSKNIILELANIGPFVLKIPFLYGIGMIVFETVTSPAFNPEQGQYLDQYKVTPANLSFKTPKYSLNEE
jgi:dCTP deaminase